MADERIASTQTSYPVMPDTSLAAYQAAYRGTGSGIGRWFNSFFGSNPSYNQWRSNLLDQYNAQIKAYDSYLSSPLGTKESASEANWNPAWLSPSSGGSASPLEYQNAPDPADQTMQGIGGLLSSMSATLGFMLKAKELTSLSLDNDIKRSESKIRSAQANYADKFYKSRADRLGFLSDWQNMLNEGELFSRYGNKPEYRDNMLHYGNSDYYLEGGIGEGLAYQKSKAEVDARKAQKYLYDAQEAFTNARTSEKEYYNEHILPILKDYYSQKLTYAEAVNDYYKKTRENEMDNRTANTISKIFFGLLNFISRATIGTTVVDVDAVTGEITGEHTSSPTMRF